MPLTSYTCFQNWHYSITKYFSLSGTCNFLSNGQKTLTYYLFLTPFGIKWVKTYILTHVPRYQEQDNPPFFFTLSPEYAYPTISSYGKIPY